MSIPVIFGIKGSVLSNEERNFFIQTQPQGFVIFSRNLSNIDELKNLISELNEVCNKPIIAVDQEGGRVQRLKPPFCINFPPASNFNNYNDIFTNYFTLGTNLSFFGFNMNFAPVADLFYEDASSVIGNRSFSGNPKDVFECCKSAILGLQAANIEAVIKHIPGHGRAKVDSHFELPYIETPLDVLEKTDFLAFKNHNASYAMTAHIVFKQLSDLPVTLSKEAIQYIKKELFSGKIITDDISMLALSKYGNLGEIAVSALEAGCDIVLHCNGNLDEMKIIAERL